ncbi:MAG: SUMF1/EgtB/PvdO family nonheme iron enzyme [Anaerolineales bacterium]
MERKLIQLNSRKSVIVAFVLVCLVLTSCTSGTEVTPSQIATATLVLTSTPELPTLTSTPAQPSATATPAFEIGSILKRDIDGGMMLYVPEGEFIMGSDEAGADEKPQHTVSLDAFWIDRTEVTNGMYAQCIKAGECNNPGTSQRAAKYDDYPVAELRWADAKSYCVWAGARLPSEAEWEKAARGTDGRFYPWGNELDQTKYYIDPKPDYFSSLQKPVGSYPDGASPYGVLDMTGSVFEWVNDIYSPTYYAESPLLNPTGPLFGGSDHVFRGGNYVDYDLRVFSRSIPVKSSEPGWVLNVNVGFRCAMDVNP